MFFFFILQMFFHGKDRKSLLKHLSASHMPMNYGGDLPMIDYGGKDWYPTINEYLDFLAKWKDYGFAKQN